MKRLLAIETTSHWLSLAILKNGRILTQSNLLARTSHDQKIFPQLNLLLRKSKTKASQIQAVAVSRGPGRFTGIRIGLAFARALGWSLQIPVWGVSSLDALAWHAAKRLKLRRDTKPGGANSLYLCPMVTAVRNEVLTALYRYPVHGPHRPDPPSSLRRISQYRWLAAEKMAEFLTPHLSRSAPLGFTGDAAQTHHKLLKTLFSTRSLFWIRSAYPQAAAVGELAQARTSAGACEPPVPLYIKPGSFEQK
ncbi:MAG: tRNA (adenosine(37)-N6)-threonylcarbamoyltransferase complex dimerization subunit type 1 TsaB [Elusimicrobia bacterium]|nr:tRNA (adenosine(37)-N6)-threonylcarbamoyltransferase complex dimerization subunit type 1 TsaB [Elusimicrobiota bacterium]